MNKTDPRIIHFVEDAEASLKDVFARIEAVEYQNTERVLDAFQSQSIALRHFAPTSGYGYDDIGRDALDRVFAKALQAEDALVRSQFTSGTQTIFTALCGLLEPGDVMLSITGKPYDTLESAIGISGDEPGSLKRQGIAYAQTELLDGKIDMPSVLSALRGNKKIRIVYVQRSRGYAWRNAILPEDMQSVFEIIHGEFPGVWIVVDNCYGEFVRTNEPTAYGADIIIGSLIKNPGGGIAPTGGYIAGKAGCIKRIENRLTVPGMGREVGSYAGGYTQFYQGLFLAPHVVAQALKTAALFACVFEKAGMTSMPGSKDMRSDIVQALRFPDAGGLCSFCRSIQASSPVDSDLVPEPWDMPGYTHQVIMAAGAFVQGSSIELSADGPLCEPFTAYIQGGLTYSHGRIAVIRSLSSLQSEGRVNIF